MYGLYTQYLVRASFTWIIASLFVIKTINLWICWGVKKTQNGVIATIRLPALFYLVYSAPINVNHFRRFVFDWYWHEKPVFFNSAEIWKSATGHFYSAVRDCWLTDSPTSPCLHFIVLNSHHSRSDYSQINDQPKLKWVHNYLGRRCAYFLQVFFLPLNFQLIKKSLNSHSYSCTFLSLTLSVEGLCVNWEVSSLPHNYVWSTWSQCNLFVFFKIYTS